MLWYAQDRHWPGRSDLCPRHALLAQRRPSTGMVEKGVLFSFGAQEDENLKPLKELILSPLNLKNTRTYHFWSQLLFTLDLCLQVSPESARLCSHPEMLAMLFTTRAKRFPMGRTGLTHEKHCWSCSLLCAQEENHQRSSDFLQTGKWNLLYIGP